MTVAALRGRTAPWPVLALALAAVYLFWGSTTPAIKVAVASIPPFAMAALRFFIAGSLLWTWSRARGRPLPDGTAVRDAALTGTLLLVGGNGLFAWCLETIPSGVGALFFALSPMWNALIGVACYRERLGRWAVAGIVLGLAGMVWLFGPSGATQLPPVPVAGGVIASLFWSAGSMIQRRHGATDVTQSSALQMLAASAVLAAVAAATGERLAAAEFTPAATAALAWLVVFGSLVGFSAYVWLARTVETVLASTYLYVNPVVAIVLSMIFLHERISPREAAGAAVVLAGVVLMMVPVQRVERPRFARRAT